MVGAEQSGKALRLFTLGLTTTWFAMFTGALASKTWLTSVSAPGACLSCNIARQRIASLFIIWMMHRRLPYAGLAFYGIEHTTGEFVVHETARIISAVCRPMYAKRKPFKGTQSAFPCAACQPSFRMAFRLELMNCGALVAGLVGFCYKVNSSISSPRGPVGACIAPRPLHFHFTERSDLIEGNVAARS